MASFFKSAARASKSSVAWREVDEHTSSTLLPVAAHISSMDLAMSIL